jgi:transposase InsO family protein
LHYKLNDLETRRSTPYDLGVDRSHSRPRVSNDNPYSEAAFKTLKIARRSLATSDESKMPAPFAKRFQALQRRALLLSFLKV